MNEIDATFAKLTAIRRGLQSLLDERGGPRAASLPYINFSQEEAESYFVDSAKQLQLLKERLPLLYGDFPQLKIEPRVA